MTATATAQSSLTARLRASRSTESLFHAIARRRQARALHPHAVAGEAVLTVDAGVAPLAGTALGTASTWACRVRLSRGVGLPHGLGDVYGLALRLVDDEGRRSGDLLLSSSFPGRVGRWIPRWHRDGAAEALLSSLQPFRNVVTGDLVMLGARLVAPPGGALLDLVTARASPRPLELLAASVGGRAVRWGTLDGVRADPGDDPRLAFDAWAPPAGMRPAGPVNALRDPAYRGSQRAWRGG